MCEILQYLEFSIVNVNYINIMSLKLNPGFIAEESDFAFVLAVGGIFLSISMVFYFCDATYRNSFYFDGSEFPEDPEQYDNGIVMKESPRIV